MNVINKIIKTRWSWGRWIRLGLGLAFLMDAYYKSSGMVAVMGAVLTYQALFNLGCTVYSCASEETRKNPNDLTHNFKNINN